MRMDHNTLKVKIIKSNNSVRLETGNDSIQILTNGSSRPNQERNDFAAWFFLPVAMRSGCNIHIEGSGSEATSRNARRMSEIWEAWFPKHFSAVDVTFEDVPSTTDAPHSVNDENLCFYSGGVDSTYTILKRHQEGKRQSLLTVHGMDYKTDNESQFLDMLEKTEPFARMVSEERLIVKTDAYGTYRKYKTNMFNDGHLTHIFVLAGVGFLHSERFNELTVAADYRLDQQFTVHPYGSNLATNFLFNDGSCSLITDSSDISRSDKLPLLATSDVALNSLTFCIDASKKPHNCGLCDKCIRTKLSFLVSTGSIPEIFTDMNIPSNWPASIKEKRGSQVFLIEIIMRAKHSGRIGEIPGGEKMYESLKGLHNMQPQKKRSMTTKIIRKYRKLIGS